MHSIIFFLYIYYIISNIMKARKFYYKGSRIYKLKFSEMKSNIERLGLDVKEIYMLLVDNKDYVYVSKGFLRGLSHKVKKKEWHHFFKRNQEGFDVYKLNFTN